ncbi:MAG: hypothetical protein P8R54_31595 [Myxococcota bacterium]|nr:hypothetical protein [Myxococcota bacterium]
MIIALTLLACTDPEAPALAACQAVPGLSTDDAGLAALSPLLVAAEIDLLKAAVPTRGQVVLGSEGLAKLRAQTTCAVTANNSAGSGRWAITLSRTLPTVEADGTLGEPQEQTLEWQVVSDDGARVETGLGIASSMRGSIDEAVEQEDYARAASSWKAILRTYGDPIIAVDIAEAEATEDAWLYRRKIDGWVERVDSAEITIAAKNDGDRDIVGATLTVTFELADGKRPLSALIGAVKAGETGRVTIPIPEDAVGKVLVKTASVQLR